MRRLVFGRLRLLRAGFEAELREHGVEARPRRRIGDLEVLLDLAEVAPRAEEDPQQGEVVAAERAELAAGELAGDLGAAAASGPSGAAPRR